MTSGPGHLTQAPACSDQHGSLPTDIFCAKPEPCEAASRFPEAGTISPSAAGNQSTRLTGTRARPGWPRVSTGMLVVLM
jgi:hypothetical protein